MLPILYLTPPKKPQTTRRSGTDGRRSAPAATSYMGLKARNTKPIVPSGA